MNPPRPNIELALDLRSWESVVVISEPGMESEYPENWHKPDSLDAALVAVNGDSIVIVDRFDISRNAMGSIVELGPRIFAVVTANIEHEKQVRRSLTALYPFSEVWTFSTDFGKVLATAASGKPYERAAE